MNRLKPTTYISETRWRRAFVSHGIENYILDSGIKPRDRQELPHPFHASRTAPSAPSFTNKNLFELTNFVNAFEIPNFSLPLPILPPLPQPLPFHPFYHTTRIYN